MKNKLKLMPLQRMKYKELVHLKQFELIAKRMSKYPLGSWTLENEPISLNHEDWYKKYKKLVDTLCNSKVFYSDDSSELLLKENEKFIVLNLINKLGFIKSQVVIFKGTN